MAKGGDMGGGQEGTVSLRNAHKHITLHENAGKGKMVNFSDFRFLFLIYYAEGVQNRFPTSPTR